jgi:hypothetical protein
MPPDITGIGRAFISVDRFPFVKSEYDFMDYHDSPGNLVCGSVQTLLLEAFENEFITDIFTSALGWLENCYAHRKVSFLPLLEPLVGPQPLGERRLGR